MATALTQGLIGTPGYQAVRGRVLGALDPTVPSAGPPPMAAPLPTAPFAPVAAPMAAPAPAATAPLQAALTTRLNPQVGETRRFPNGRTGKWDGTGWLHVG